MLHGEGRSCLERRRLDENILVGQVQTERRAKVRVARDAGKVEVRRHDMAQPNLRPGRERSVHLVVNSVHLELRCPRAESACANQARHICVNCDMERKVADQVERLVGALPRGAPKQRGVRLSAARKVGVKERDALREPHAPAVHHLLDQELSAELQHQLRAKAVPYKSHRRQALVRSARKVGSVGGGSQAGGTRALERSRANVLHRSVGALDRVSHVCARVDLALGHCDCILIAELIPVEDPHVVASREPYFDTICLRGERLNLVDLRVEDAPIDRLAKATDDRTWLPAVKVDDAGTRTVKELAFRARGASLSDSAKPV
mmetsp:Transcript_1105/g.3197  ORF Transcript_1105/g.3197 Transcript_1105/m.3197 type:complete len:320 (+) Transcript_1105:351-1310(+)